MSFNIGGFLTGGLTGALAGANPISAVIGAVTGGLSSNDFCNFDNFEESLKVFFSRATFSTRSPERYDRLNMITAAFRVSYQDMLGDC